VVLGSCNYINHACGLFGGCSWFLVNFSFSSSSFTLANSCALGWSMEMNGLRTSLIPIII
jgi:hypothetical protein